MSKPLISVDEDGSVLCPECGQAAGLHFDRVDVTTASGRSVRVSASGEDSNSSVAIEILNAKDSGRRHSLVLHWWCELCSHDGGTITLKQHKGTTEASRGQSDSADDR